MPAPQHDIRAAEPRDLDAIVLLIGELAEFENLSHLLEVTPQKLEPHLFGDRPAVECMVGEIDGEVVAFALYFTNFSTFLAKPGLYLEDLYVRPAHRRSGLGRALIIQLAQLACERGYGRFDWTVLDWNEDAIRFYEKLGAEVLADWRICRLSGEALERYADGDRPSMWSTLLG
ncbi:GNAT family N-acetyltransferase [Pelomonas sp. Root1444]|uniref:GNAT family N-acetyltransferase n=1 Tax=Pelomonas sp. Root1444 TaxID=1736464 RepID=UPI000703A1D0|nr:GNAT family N-acetyltransferase [Pelomonas sp. Root1444]KQY88844.1 GCN5 family acetyltransferase [Pelomonas sp. Root1444]